MTTYRVTCTDGLVFLMRVDLTEAAAMIRIRQEAGQDDRDWHITPFQTIDVGHDVNAAAQICAQYFGAEPGNRRKVQSVEREDRANDRDH
jgi:hypothetical protein